MEFEQLQRAIEAILFAAGERIEIPRLCGISASRVRALMQERKLDDIRALVPEESYAAIARRLTRDA